MVPIPSLRKSKSSRRSLRVSPRLESVEPRLLMATGHKLLIATLGDSLTDEYQFTGPMVFLAPSPSPAAFDLHSAPGTFGRNGAQNWVSNLAATRSSQVSFGTYTTANLSETRNQGYTENWARGGVASTGLNVNSDNATFVEEYAGTPGAGLPGLLTQTKATTGHNPSDVNVVTIFVGTNDYSRALMDYAQSNGQINEFQTPANGVSAVNAGIEGAVQTAVAKIHAKIPKAKVVVITPPDPTSFPLTQQNLDVFAKTLPPIAPTMVNSVNLLEADMARMAKRQNFGLVDYDSILNQFHTSPTIDGVTLNLEATGQDYTDGFNGDGTHPGTILQGKLAQAIVAKINSMSGSNVIKPLSDAEIVQYAEAVQPTITLTESTPDATQQVTLKATVTPEPGTRTPTGNVTFNWVIPSTTDEPGDYAKAIATVPIDSSGVATLNINLASYNNTTLYAVYNGDQYFNARVSTGVFDSI